MLLAGVFKDRLSSSHLRALVLKWSLTISHFCYETRWDGSEVKMSILTIPTLPFLCIFAVTKLISQTSASSSLQIPASAKVLSALVIWIMPGQSCAVKQKRTLRCMYDQDLISEGELWRNTMDRTKGASAACGSVSLCPRRATGKFDGSSNTLAVQRHLQRSYSWLNCTD